MATKKNQHIYFFGNGKAQGNAKMKTLLGGKGANLAEMTSIKIPVPPGFTITTNTCAEYYELGKKLPKTLLKEIDANITKLEKSFGKKFGDKSDPLLVSIRSGAAASMPGMMDTVLNLGLTDASVEAFAKKTGNAKFAYDSYRRFIQMFGDVVMDVPHSEFEKALRDAKKKAKAVSDMDLSSKQLSDLIKTYKAIYKKHTKKNFPNDPKEQLLSSIKAVFSSWDNERANLYKRMNDLRGLNGTAVNVQAMVFGNMGETSGTGVCFTRNPSNGENKFYGEYLMNAQGEDVVAGIRTPNPISSLAKKDKKSYNELTAIRTKLEKHYKDMQDIEFTIQEGKLYILQTRNGKRTTQAAVKIAVDKVKEKLITEKQAVLEIDPNSLDQLLHPTFDPASEKAATILLKGLPASPGAASGRIAFTNAQAAKYKDGGDQVILVRNETSPEDLAGMDASRGILTAMGGMTSHAAVVARGMGKCCVCGASTGTDLRIDEKAGKLSVTANNGKKYTFKTGDYISLSVGKEGVVLDGKLKTQDPELKGSFNELMKMADKFRKMKVRTNADTPKDTKIAIKFGAEGIGLCRTEHMFFEGDRIIAVREMILAADEKGRRKALKKLLPIQRKDFYEMYLALNGMPCTIRLIDPPLHEFLPHDAKGQAVMAKAMKKKPSEIKELVDDLHESNPMLGHRGCRLAITYPEILEMQVRAIIEAAVDAKKKKKVKVLPEIMIPLVGHVKEFTILKAIALKTIGEVLKEKKVAKNYIDYKIGTMIEVPRAAITADEIAKEAEFFSFGTNDLTQMGCGFSRDDAGKFLTEYTNAGIYEYDPFQVIDEAGVGELVKIAVQKGRKVRKNIKLGICGEHGGEPKSVNFCHKVGLDYVSCSPFRVPIAKLAAAQASIR
ncbi:MAG: pyruvate, phosphate dikinase [Planctomycetota bacterium]|nr:MAG: pyruvate, phosphate dikinase [Planctomycetota bacterium]